MDFLHPVHISNSHLHTDDTQHSSLDVRWFPVTDEASLLDRLSGEGDGEKGTADNTLECSFFPDITATIPPLAYLTSQVNTC